MRMGVICMSKILGNTLPPEVKDIFNREITSVVLSTITPEGFPHAMPVHLLCSPDEKTILMALVKNHQTTKNIMNNGKAMITALDGEDIAVGIKGTAKVVKEPMDANKAMVAIAFEVEEIKSDTTPTVIVTQGVRFKHRSNKTEEFFRMCFNELYNYGKMSK